jgi:hypothetical protein
MKEIITSVGDTLFGMAAKYLGDTSYFRNLCDINGFNPLASTPLPGNVMARVPNIKDVAPIVAKKIINSSGVAGTVGRAISEISSGIEKLEKMPDEYSGYPKIAIQEFKNINGVEEMGEVLSTLSEGIKLARTGTYSKKVRNLTDWLLPGSDDAGGRVIKDWLLDK